MYAILLGPDRGLGAALDAHGVRTARLDGRVSGDALAAADVAVADLLVLTDVTEASIVPVAREANPDLRVVVYDSASMPDFVRGQVDLAVAPDVLDPAVVAEELAGVDG